MCAHDVHSFTVVGDARLSLHSIPIQPNFFRMLGLTIVYIIQLKPSKQEPSTLQVQISNNNLPQSLHVGYVNMLWKTKLYSPTAMYAGCSISLRQTNPQSFELFRL